MQITLEGHGSPISAEPGDTLLGSCPQEHADGIIPACRTQVFGDTAIRLID
jgi:hypothetical protein